MEVRCKTHLKSGAWEADQAVDDVRVAVDHLVYLGGQGTRGQQQQQQQKRQIQVSKRRQTTLTRRNG